MKTAHGWRVLFVSEKCSLSLSNDNVVIKSEESEKVVAISQLSTVIIDCFFVRISGALIATLANFGVKVIFCDEFHSPSCETTSYNIHNQALSKIQEQIMWDEYYKGDLWSIIVKEKIKMQKAALIKRNLEGDSKLDEYISKIYSNDPFNMEGQAAKLYFKKMFGDNFIRHNNDFKNIALNYGYAIITSHISKVIVHYGYLPNIGIKHCSDSNPFNLTYDLIEVLRPYVDLIVADNSNYVFDKNYKKKLIAVLYSKIKYGDMVYEIFDFVFVYLNDFFKSMREKINHLKEISYIE